MFKFLIQDVENRDRRYAISIRHHRWRVPDHRRRLPVGRLQHPNVGVCDPEQRRAAAHGELGRCQQKMGEAIAWRAPNLGQADIALIARR
jgi:hypothetical protein